MITHYSISENTIRFMKRESASKAPKETGGLLVGRLSENYVLIEHATGPGPQALHQRSRFRRDGQYSQDILDSIVTQYGRESDYIGEWHSHPQNAGPSALDYCSMKWIEKNNDYKINAPVLGLCIKGESCEWRFSFFVLAENGFSKLHNLNDMTV